MTVLQGEHRRRVLKTLSIYADRGEAALAALLADDLDDFDAAMQGRVAAFHNFRALDALASEAGLDGFDLAADPDGRQLWARTADVNARLAQSITAARMRLGALLARNTSASAYARACHSGVSAPARLVKAG